MDADEFLKTATDPQQWIEKSVWLRHSADRLWDSFVYATAIWARSARARATGSSDEALWDEAWEYLTSAKLLYGLALETAFKSAILRTRPDEIEFKLSADGSGSIQQAEMIQFGGPMGSGHNLEQLGQRAGLFNADVNPVFETDSDYRAIREILRHLTEVVVWSGRYPVPRRSGDRYREPPDVPARVFGHYIRDWIDEVLDRYQEGSWKPTQVLRPEQLIDMVDRFERLSAKSAEAES